MARTYTTKMNSCLAAPTPCKATKMNACLSGHDALQNGYLHRLLNEPRKVRATVSVNF